MWIAWLNVCLPCVCVHIWWLSGVCGLKVCVWCCKCQMFHSFMGKLNQQLFETSSCSKSIDLIFVEMRAKPHNTHRIHLLFAIQPTKNNEQMCWKASAGVLPNGLITIWLDLAPNTHYSFTSTIFRSKPFMAQWTSAFRILSTNIRHSMNTYSHKHCQRKTFPLLKVYFHSLSNLLRSRWNKSLVRFHFMRRPPFQPIVSFCSNF